MRDLFSKCINTIIKRKMTQFKIAKDLNRPVFRKIYKWPISKLKAVQHH